LFPYTTLFRSRFLNQVCFGKSEVQEEFEQERNVMSLVKIAAKGVAVGLTLALVSVVKANEIKGKVSVQGIKSAENIAVYVDVIPDKKFDAPKDPVVVDQRKMAFVPHVVAVQQGTTVEFLNSDSVGHNVYWPSISGNKKLAHNLCTRKCRVMSSSPRLPISQSPTRTATLKSRTFLPGSTR